MHDEEPGIRNLRRWTARDKRSYDGGEMRNECNDRKGICFVSMKDQKIPNGSDS